MSLLKAFAIAISMYSKIPAPSVEWNEKNMKYAMCFFPVVGAVIGILLLTAGYFLTGEAGCSSLLTGCVMTLLPVAVTGGIHLDGFADTVDALSSWGDRERKLQILKDPNTGAFAVIWLGAYYLLSLGLWTELAGRIITERAGIPPAAGMAGVADLLFTLPSGRLLCITACSFLLSRSLSGIAVVTFPAAKDSGLLKTFQDGAQRRRVRIVLALWAAAASAAMIRLSAAAGSTAVLAALVLFLYYYRMSSRQFGGITGDLAGYFLQICELGMLTAVVVAGMW